MSKIAFPSLFCFLVALAFAPLQANAQVSFDEIVSGELSGDNAAPTDLGIFSVGTNSVAGLIVDATGANPNVDVFTFEIAAGTQLDGIVLSEFGSDDDLAFLGFNDSNTFPFDSTALGSGPDQSQFTGGLLFGQVTNTNILDDIGGGGIGSGFSGPLNAGEYTVFLQQLGGSTVDYEFQFNVSSTAAIPEPTSAIVLAGLGLAGLIRRRR